MTPKTTYKRKDNQNTDKTNQHSQHFQEQNNLNLNIQVWKAATQIITCHISSPVTTRSEITVTNHCRVTNSKVLGKIQLIDSCCRRTLLQEITGHKTNPWTEHKAKLPSTVPKNKINPESKVSMDMTQMRRKDHPLKLFSPKSGTKSGVLQITRWRYMRNSSLNATELRKK